VPDWLKLKTEYVTGDVTLKALSEKYGINESSVRRQSAAENWVNLKKQHIDKVATLAQQKAAEKKANEAAKITALKDDSRVKIWREMNRRLGDNVEEMDGSDFRRMIQNFCDMSANEPDVLPDDKAAEDDLSKSLRELARKLNKND
jgi:hypothetical protein